MESDHPRTVTSTALYGVAARPMPGQDVSGDAWIIHELPRGLLVAVIDGLGHGPSAHDAGEKARAAILANPDRPLTNLMQAAHVGALGTRGAVAGLLRLDFATNQAHYVGVGNIGIHVVSKHTIKPISRNGTVGYRMPQLFEQHAKYDPGDIFILFSDGVSMRFADQPVLRQGLPSQLLADQLLAGYGKDSDDATVVVIHTPSAPVAPEA